MTLEGRNGAKVPGDFIPSLGCSSQPYKGSGIQKSRQLAPTQKLTPRKQNGPSATQLVGDPASDACSGVPFCQAQAQPVFSMSGWDTTTKSYMCTGEYPYAWNFGYQQSGSPSVSAIGAQFELSPQSFDVLLTNWNPFQTDLVQIWVGCSKSNYWGGGTCGAPQSDPGCPVVSGSDKNYCSKGPVPVCFQVYQERCQPSNQLYQCTIDVIIPYCQPCPG